MVIILRRMPLARVGCCFRNPWRPPSATSFSISVCPELTKQQIANLSCLSLATYPLRRGRDSVHPVIARNSRVTRSPRRRQRWGKGSTPLLFLKRRIVGCITSLSLHTLIRAGDGTHVGKSTNRPVLHCNRTRHAAMISYSISHTSCSLSSVNGSSTVFDPRDDGSA